MSEAEPKVAFTFSGGSIKFGYEVGVAAALFRLGVTPHIITGTSAGAFVTGYCAGHQPDTPAGWPAVGAAMTAFVTRELTGPDRLIRKRGILALGWRFLTKRWDGVVDTAPLAALTRRALADRLPRAGGLVARVATVNLRTGALEYVGADSPAFLDAVLASAAEPVTMPLRTIGQDRYVDGGVREIAPLAEAIRQGADRIYCIVCQPERVGESGANWGDLFALVGRLTTIATNEIVNNDLVRCQEVNQAVAAGAAPGKRHVEVVVIRPAQEIPVDIQSFGPADIARMIQQGERDATMAMTGGYDLSMDAA